MDEKLEVGLNGHEFKHVLDEHFDSLKKEFNLKKVDIEVLYYLSACEKNNTPTDIYKRLKLNRGHVSQAIDTLVKRGYIDAVPDETDRRSVHYVTCPSAAALIERIREVRLNLEEKIFEGINPEELAIYKKVSYQILKNIDDMI